MRLGKRFLSGFLIVPFMSAGTAIAADISGGHGVVQHKFA